MNRAFPELALATCVKRRQHVQPPRCGILPPRGSGAEFRIRQLHALKRGVQ
jgi:hypothetical protein